MGRIAWQLLAGVALAALGILALGPGLSAAPAVALAAIAPELARIDLAEHRLPNRMLVPGILFSLATLGAAWACTSRPPLVPVVAALLTGAALLGLNLLGGMGLGDVKLGVLLGLASPTVLTAVSGPLLAFFAGGIASAIALALGRRGHRIAFGPYLLAGWAGSLVVAILLGR